jgi:4'-phosphopantetheinyl transferase
VKPVPDWPLGSDRQNLKASEIHVWLAYLDLRQDEMASLRSTLSLDELSRAANFHFDEHRERFVAAHGILREILSRYVGIKPQDIQFDLGPFGKPFLKDSEGESRIRFNLSHSGSCALIAVTNGKDVGVDLEQVQPERTTVDIAERYFSAGEVTALRALPASQRCEAFFQCWARKEAYIKALGGGLQIPLDSFEVSLAPNEPARIVKGDIDKWSLRSLDVGQEYAGALAAEGQIFDLRCFRWAATIP